MIILHETYEIVHLKRFMNKAEDKIAKFRPQFLKAAEENIAKGQTLDNVPEYKKINHLIKLKNQFKARLKTAKLFKKPNSRGTSNNEIWAKEAF